MHRVRHIVPLNYPHVIPLIILNLGFFDDVVRVQAQHQLQQLNNTSASGDVVSNFQPSLAVVIGILTIMFMLTFLLLIYAKFCHRAGETRDSTDPTMVLANVVTRSRRFSGIDKTAIESLPFFRFSSLRGSRAGLECAVCLSKFEDIEILRLLPKCKHAFHIDCIDHWLERHSTCPLCRYRVTTDDPSIFTYSHSMRLLSSSQSDRVQDSSGVEIFIEREEDDDEGSVNTGSSSRFNIGIGSSFRKLFKGSSNANTSKDEESLIDQEQGNQKMLHKFNHRIIVSDVVFQNRWSNVSSSDLMFLNSEMLCTLSSDRFSGPETFKGKGLGAEHRKVENDQNQIGKIKEEMDRKRLFESRLSTISKSSLISGPSANTGVQLSGTNCSEIVKDAEKRSQSEITGLSRFGNMNITIGTSGRYGVGHRNQKDEHRRQLWFPIARRTVQWFANRERRDQDPVPDVVPMKKATPDSLPM